MPPQDCDPIFEAILRQAIKDNIYEEAETVPTDDVLTAMFIISERHELRMRRMCAQEDRREQALTYLRPLRKIIAAALIAIAVLFSAIMMNSSVQAAVVEVIIEWYEQFTRFIGVGDNVFVESFEIRSWAPDCIPEGYSEVSIFEGDPTIIEYEDEDANLIVFRYSLDVNDLRVDNEDSEYSTTEIDGITYYIFDTDPSRKPNVIIWFFEGYRFNISGNLHIENLLKMAKSVKII